MKRGNKRSQIPSTVFIYALAAIIIALILIFGYKAIGKLIQTSTATETAKFKADLKNIIIEDTSYGKRDFVSISIPTGYEELCFVMDNLAGNNPILERYPLAQDVAESANNVFLADIDGNIDPFYVEAFEIEQDPDYETTPEALCIKQASGELKFRIEGQGDRALIVPVGP